MKVVYERAAVKGSNVVGEGAEDAVYAPRLQPWAKHCRSCQAGCQPGSRAVRGRRRVLARKGSGTEEKGLARAHLPSPGGSPTDRLKFTSVLRWYLCDGKLDREEAQTALEIAFDLSISFPEEERKLHQSASDRSARPEQKSAYEAVYAALSERLKADLRTADRLLYEGLKGAGMERVRWAGVIEQ